MTDGPSAQDFGRGFVFGTATSSYQIEGAVDADGRGPSIWDTFSHRPGTTYNGDTGDVAVDHYHRWREDLDLLDWLGVDAYRFSIAWPRVLPDGRGKVNQDGLDFYRRLVDELRRRDIEPFVTLYHWDLPQALQDTGGWADRGTAEAFVEYARVVGEALDGVTHWATLNEPWCAAFLGYRSGVHAPGIQDPAQAVAAAHHLLLAHGRATDVLRTQDPHREIGIVLNLAPIRTVGDTDADREAARVVDGGRNRAWTDPIFRGRYPEDVLADWAPLADLSVVRDGDHDDIATPIDWLGINYYNPIFVGAGDGTSPEPGADAVAIDPPGSPSLPTTAMGWPIDASGLAEIVDRIAADYGPIPLYITENGAAFDDEVGPDSQVADDDRVDYLTSHLQAVADLLAAGVDLRGYFVWSLLDNFEWAEGYRRRFGIVRVDYDTQQRTPKASARFYRDLLASRSTG